jgi:hypothetical protein
MNDILDERDFAHAGDKTATIRAEDVAASSAFRKMYETLPNVVSAEDMPWEKSADGLIKHLVHHKMNTRERCVEAYMQFLKPGERSGKHRHMWEEVLFVVEGSGYDLHWDLKFDCIDGMERGAEEARVAARRFHLCAALHDPPALQRRPQERSPPDRDLQPHGQGDGLRLVRSDRERAGHLTL